MNIIFLLVLFIVILLMESEREKDMLSIERVSFTSAKIKENKKLIFITDLHDKEFDKNNERLISCIQKEKPDYILMGGNIIPKILTKR